MALSDSEDFLKKLADQTFLKLWAIPNTFYKKGKELADLVIPFGDDIIIISDKASNFDTDAHGERAWSRWYGGAVEKSVAQLAGALRTVTLRPEIVSLDAKLSEPMPLPLNEAGRRRIHLVGIARPGRDPSKTPADWEGLIYVSGETHEPFKICKLIVQDRIVHVFDGPTINLLLKELDTVSDFVSYLKGREAALLAADNYAFAEKDLLGAALIGCETDPLGLPSVPPLDAVVPGLWDMYNSSKRVQVRRELDEPSRVIDRYINQQYEEFLGKRFLGEKPTFAQHENAMGLLAAEGRFARRIIAHELYDLLGEEDETTFWATTLRSPTTPRLRYVWMTYPPRPSDISEEQGDMACLTYMRQHVVVAEALFEEELVMGICVPNWEGYGRVLGGAQSRYGEGAHLAVPALRKDGRQISIEFTILPIHDDAGSLRGIAAFLRDATDRFEEVRALRRELAASKQNR